LYSVAYKALQPNARWVQRNQSYKGELKESINKKTHANTQKRENRRRSRQSRSTESKPGPRAKTESDGSARTRPHNATTPPASGVWSTGHAQRDYIAATVNEA
jgi:hypothetical protein